MLHDVILMRKNGERLAKENRPPYLRGAIRIAEMDRQHNHFKRNRKHAAQKFNGSARKLLARSPRRSRVNSTHPTLLRIPAWYSSLAHDEVVLPLPPNAYAITQVDNSWRVTICGTDELVYAGNGPVEIVVSRAPF